MKYEYLNKEDEYELINHYQDGDESALTKLIHFNQLNIGMIVGRYKNPYDSDYQDAIQEANISLIKAIKTFDTSSGNRLISYASFIIKNDIIKKVMVHSNTIKIPYITHKHFKEIEAGIIDDKTNDTIRAYNTNFNCYDIDDNYDKECHSTYDENLINFENKEMIDYLFSFLTNDEIFILESRYGLNNKPILPLEEISKHFDKDSITNYKSYGYKLVKGVLNKLKKFNNRKC